MRSLLLRFAFHFLFGLFVRLRFRFRLRIRISVGLGKALHSLWQAYRLPCINALFVNLLPSSRLWLSIGC